jgi:hypothetical protein
LRYPTSYFQRQHCTGWLPGRIWHHQICNSFYALDSTTHTLLDLRGNIPSFIRVSDGKLHDVHALDLLIPEAGAIYVIDRGYVDFARLHVLKDPPSAPRVLHPAGYR